MITVTILVFDYALAAAVMSMSELLYFAGNAYQRAHLEDPQEALESFKFAWQVEMANR